MNLKDAIKQSLNRVGKDDPTERDEENMRDQMIATRSSELQELGMTWNGRFMGYTKKDFNVHNNEIICSTDEEWDAILERIKTEMNRRAELKPFKDVEREVMEVYWRIRLHKCGTKDIPHEEGDRNEFIDFLLDIDYFDTILNDVSKEWDMIMREYIDNFYIPQVNLGRGIIFIDDWKHYK